MTAHDFHLVCPNPGGRRFVRLRGEDVPMPHAPIASELRALAWVIQQRWDTAWPRSTLRLLQHLRHYRAGDVRAAIDTVCCPGPILTSLLERCGLPVVELPNPAPPPQPISPRGTDGPLRLAFLGRLEPEKGIASFANDLHRAATRTATSEHACPPVSLDIFGEGSLAAELEQTRAVARAHEPSRLSITLHGRRPRDEAVDALRRCHALVLPSEWDEVAPLVLDEAVAAGASLLVSGAAPAEYVRRTGIGRVLPSAEQRTAHGLDPLVAILKDMRAAMLAGTLNDFDPAAALAGRSLDDHLDALERVYRGEPLPDRRGATEAAR